MCSNFEKFWEIYPQPWDKQRAFYQFQKLNPDKRLFDKILTSLRRQIEIYNDRVAGGDWVPGWKYPANWLSQESWNQPLVVDEVYQ